MKLEAYLFFPGTTEEAMNFYQGIFGGDLSITRRGDVDPTATESDKGLVINAALDSGAFTLRASDRVDAIRRRPDQDRADRQRERGGRSAKDIRGAA